MTVSDDMASDEAPIKIVIGCLRCGVAQDVAPSPECTAPNNITSWHIWGGFSTSGKVQSMLIIESTEPGPQTLALQELWHTAVVQTPVYYSKPFWIPFSTATSTVRIVRSRRAFRKHRSK